uniref:Class II aldolase/adducin N-terminal domain-containing protein n=1 Tax=Magnetococcus massalia (strain MO-1) TaxID=451514 RepID=A0A1S7LIA4_MAGMO|nr:Putative protein with short-chain dehydrogenase/reductase SDR domain and class II aldolase and adducin N-terminal domain [Candidatus Magnetococcus massalia]
MENRWSGQEAQQVIIQWGTTYGDALALRAYSGQLLGDEKALVLHGGGNTSVKGRGKNLFGQEVPLLWVKGSGYDLATMGPDDYVAMDLEALKKAQYLESLSDPAMANLLAQNRLDSRAPMPSIETLLHAFIPSRFVDHTHADAILALTNRTDGAAVIRQALGDAIITVPYIHPGFELARAAWRAYQERPDAKGMVLMGHGLFTWGSSAKESYGATIELVSQAEAWLMAHAKPSSLQLSTPSDPSFAAKLRGALMQRSHSTGDLPGRMLVRGMQSPDVLSALSDPDMRPLLEAPPITSDHVIRMGPFPLWLEVGEELGCALDRYRRRYAAYFEAQKGARDFTMHPPLPQLVMVPGEGIFCCGKSDRQVLALVDLMQQNLLVKMAIKNTTGEAKHLTSKECFDMEYFMLQESKMATPSMPPLTGSVAIITGAAGAIGSGICRHLLELGCCVAATDLPGDGLDTLGQDLALQFGSRVAALPMDVTAPEQVEAVFAQLTQRWGGVDLVIINAGLAHVSKLEEMDLERFRLLEKVNIEGTLNLLGSAGRHFRLQSGGGDIVLISTKNVFAPGAGFGAYSATKAASHQLARIAVQEMAPMGVRVNMVAPDAVFSDGERKSGLWQEVGPDRMKARGLDEAGLESYYQQRNLLKAKIRAEHVAKGVAYFATRQSPTTGATLPVDGGLPDATPR